MIQTLTRKKTEKLSKDKDLEIVSRM